jgi:hypothetical protein
MNTTSTAIVVAVAAAAFGLTSCGKQGGTAQADRTANALASYVAPGEKDEYYLFYSGGHSGQVYVAGIPSLRHITTIPVFAPYPATGYGFDDESRKMLGDFTWGDVHHPALSQTNSKYDGRWLFVNDVRLHPFFDTIEFRICDAQSRVDDTIALAALMQAIVAKLQKLRWDNVTFRSYPKRLLDENRWRASRYGLDGKLIDFGRKCEVDERDLLNEMLEFVSTEVEELGNQREIEHIERIMREGTGADRQLMVWERTQDMKAVVDQIVVETNEGLTPSTSTTYASAL